VRTGILISAASHIVLVAFALLGTPKLFDNAPLQTIEVDLVRAQEVEPEPPPLEPEKKSPEKTAEWNPLPEASTAQAKPAAPRAAAAPSTPKQPPATQQARVTQPTERTTQQTQAAQTPPAEPPAQQSAQPWIFDPSNIPALMNLPNAPKSDFDSEATAAANISADERTAFKAYLKKCWKLPDGLSAAQTTRVTLRIFLKRDGGLAAEPMLIEASASREGPLLMQAAIRSVKECQPFAFLPPDRYREWKTLDVSFSPKEMAGG
jgi:hypothetical protein